MVYSARRGFTTIGNSMQAGRAKGSVVCWLHPFSGNPQEETSDYFYLVTVPGEDVLLKFAERLNLAVPWPVVPEWAEGLWEAGRRAGLVIPLTLRGPDIASAHRIAKSEDEWREVITAELGAGRIQVA
jgi:hypothetical protein